MMPSKLETVHSAPSYRLSNDSVSLKVTEVGGHVGPVEFTINGRTYAPYSLPPWRVDECPVELPPLVKVLRGDYFCLPFGDSTQQKYIHGETANGRWSKAKTDRDELLLTIKTEIPSARVSKRITLRDAEAVVYIMHGIEGLSGDFSYGHHPVLHVPEGTTACIRSSPFSYGQVYPGLFSDPSRGERQILEPGAQFDRLSSIPMMGNGRYSLASYPSEEEHDDLVMIAYRDTGLVWTAVTLHDYVWLSIKNSADFPSSLFWISNGGRSEEPWNGRHTRRIGIEDVCSYFHEGFPKSRQQPLKDKGIPTVRTFEADKQYDLPHIQMVVPVQPDFGGVRNVEFLPDNSISLESENGQRAGAQVNWQFVE